MYRLKPLNMWMIHNMIAEHSTDFDRNPGFCTDKIDIPQQVVYICQLFDMWSDRNSYIRQYPNDLPFLSIVKLPDLIVHLKKLYRFHINCLSGCRFIMNHPPDPPFVSTPEWNNQSAFTQCHLCPFINPSTFSDLFKDLVHPLLYSSLKPVDTLSDLCQFF